ncbi:MAG: hypothetical protein K0Q59_5949, partial [Paenibacillus sp.]|nr:hypothetical protein [Paenibacillus sp.]
MSGKFVTAWLTVAAGAAALLYVCVLRPIVGVADNGDYLRIMLSTGLDYLQPEPSYADKYFAYFIRELRLTELGVGSYISTQVPLVLIATWINKLLYSTTVFDMRFMAGVYGALLLAAFWALGTHRGARPMPMAGRIALGLLLVFVFADAGYTGYFNSLFGEPVSLTFLLLTVALALTSASRDRPSRWLLAAFFICAICLTGSKTQNAPIG